MIEFVLLVPSLDLYVYLGPLQPVISGAGDMLLLSTKFKTCFDFVFLTFNDISVLY
jgi:hypothetical protein